MSEQNQHSSFLDAVEDVRVYLTWVPPDHAKGAADALASLVEQLEAYERFEDNVRDVMDFMPHDGHYAALNAALGSIRTSNPAKSLCDMTHPGEPCPAIVQSAAGENPDAAGGNSGRSAPSPATEGGGAQGEFDPPDPPSVLDADIDTEGANAGWTGAPTPAISQEGNDAA